MWAATSQRHGELSSEGVLVCRAEQAGETPTLAALAGFAAEFKPLPASAAAGGGGAAAGGGGKGGMTPLGGSGGGKKSAAAHAPAPVAAPPKLGAWGRGADVSGSFLISFVLPPAD